jgi:hypothetical protein
MRAGPELSADNIFCPRRRASVESNLGSMVHGKVLKRRQFVQHAALPDLECSVLPA